MQVEYPKPKWTDKFLLLDMFEGLKTTFKELFRPKVTIRYPEERLEPADRFRGMFRFSYDRCIACKLCALACPIDIIYIDVQPPRMIPYTAVEVRAKIRSRPTLMLFVTENVGGGPNGIRQKTMKDGSSGRIGPR